MWLRPFLISSKAVFWQRFFSPFALSMNSVSKKNLIYFVDFLFFLFTAWDVAKFHFTTLRVSIISVSRPFSFSIPQFLGISIGSADTAVVSFMNEHWLNLV
jgi:hypothetical protein